MQTPQDSLADYARAIPDSRGQNLFRADPDLMGLLGLYVLPELLAHIKPHLDRLGELAGTTIDELAALADREQPRLVVRRRNGQPSNEIEFHPAYHELERIGFSEFGLAAASHVPGVLGWTSSMPPIVKYVLFYIFGQAEHGLTCPLNMTDSLTRTLKKHADPEITARYFGRLTSQNLGDLMQGAMFMTERHAGSDIARTQTVARSDGKNWRLYGDKWFCSNASADLIMVLARPEDAPPGMAGVTLYLMPRLLEDGTANNYRFISMKDKICARSMATAETQLDGAVAFQIGDVGRGFNIIAEMVMASRLSNSVRSAALMRRAYSEATYFARNRSVFGKAADTLPLMRLQLDKIKLPTEQARSFAFHVAAALEKADEGDAEAARFVRLTTPLAKFRACRDARKATGDAMEVRAGCGIVEEWVEPRLMRDTYVGTIAEGTSNIIALDVYRSIQRGDVLRTYSEHLHKLLERVGDATLRSELKHNINKVVSVAKTNALGGNEILARDTASSLYHVGCAAIFAWEASHPDLSHRSQLARDVVKHRLEPAMRRLAIDSTHVLPETEIA